MARWHAASLVGLAIGTCVALGPATAAEETWSASPANTRVITRFARVMLCPEKIWPGWAVDALNIVLIDFPAQDAVLFTGPRGATAPGGNKASRRKIPYEAVPAHLKQPGPGFAMWRTEKFGEMIAVYHSATSQGDIDEVVAMALHEAFHFTGQKGFGRPSVRGTRYPEDVNARYLRQEIMRSLRAAIDGAELGPVAYWAQEFSARAHAFDPRWVDRLEGSAEYVGEFALAVASKGCKADDDVLAAEALHHASRDEGYRIGAPVRASADSEAFPIGMYAGLLLRRSGRAGWQQGVEKGATPLEILIENVQPVAQPQDAELLAAMTAIVESQNAFYKGRIDALRHDLQSPQRAIVAFRGFGGNSFTSPAPPQGGSVTYQADGDTVRAHFGARARPNFGAKAGTLSLKGVDMFEAKWTPCGGGGFLVPVNRDGVKKLDDDRIAIATDTVEATNLQVSMRWHDGTSWFCVVSNLR